MQHTALHQEIWTGVVLRAAQHRRVYAECVFLLSATGVGTMLLLACVHLHVLCIYVCCASTCMYICGTTHAPGGLSQHGVALVVMCSKGVPSSLHQLAPKLVKCVSAVCVLGLLRTSLHASSNYCVLCSTTCGARNKE